MSSSLDSIYKRLAPSLEPGGAGIALEAKPDSARHISPAVAHELNNILTIIQGYTDRLLMKKAEHPAIEGHLKLISEATKRAATIVRTAVTSQLDAPATAQPTPTPPAV